MEIAGISVPNFPSPEVDRAETNWMTLRTGLAHNGGLLGLDGRRLDMTY